MSEILKTQDYMSCHESDTKSVASSVRTTASWNMSRQGAPAYTASGPGKIYDLPIPAGIDSSANITT